MTKILIGVDGSDRSDDAVAFGRALAVAARAPVILAIAHEPNPHGHRHDSHRAGTEARDAAEAALARLSIALHDVEDVELRPLADYSAARALHTTAERENAGIIVVGSSHVGRLGRVFPGSTAERLLHGAPCPVAVVPLGFGVRALPARPVIGCAYRPTEEGAAALGAAEELALALSGSLRVMQVVEPVPRLTDTGEMPLNLPGMNAAIRADAARALHERVASLAYGLEAEGTLEVGWPAETLVGLSEAVDVMVVGSRGYGPLRAVLLGGVTGRVIRSAACPVIVVPRGARATIGSLFGPTAVGGSAG